MFIEKVKRLSVEGKFFRRAAQKISNKLLRLPDRYLGIFCRNFLFNQVDVEPNKIFFFTFQGDYTCNPKYITEELIKEKVDCEIVWGVRLSQIKRSYQLPESVRVVNRYTYDFYREMASSKIWIMNSVEIFKNPVKKKKSQVLIQTWHGSLGIKRFDKNVNSGKAWVKAATISSKVTDYCISNSDFESSVYRDSFWPDNDILEYGHPRNDILLKQGEEIEQLKIKIKEELGLAPNEKCVLYAPTFRDEKNFDCYDIEYEKLVDALKSKFGGEWRVLVRFHPTVRSMSIGKLRENQEILDVTFYPDIQELMLISDVAITDYSSWIYDFVLTKRPGFIYATDIENYYNERGFYYPLESTPFSISRNNEQLIENISSFDMCAYEKKVDEFLMDKSCYEDGSASERVVSKIKEIIYGDGNK